MLYALRYEKHSNNDLTGLVEALARRGVPEKQRKVRQHLFLDQRLRGTAMLKR